MKFNEMDYSKDKAIAMAKILVERFGCTDKKKYPHVYGNDNLVQTFNWDEGYGSLFINNKVYIGKFEIFEDYNGEEYGHGYFCADFEEK